MLNFILFLRNNIAKLMKIADFGGGLLKRKGDYFKEKALVF